MEKKKINFKRNFNEYWGFLRMHKSYLVILAILIILIEVSFIADKYIFKILVDKGTEFSGGSIIVEQFISITLALLAAYLFLKFIQAISEWVKIHYITKLDAKLIQDLKVKYFNHILNLDHKFHTENKTGSLISRLNRGGGAVETLTDVLMFSFIPMFVTIISIGIALASVSIIPSIIILVITIVFVSYSIFIQHIQGKSKLEYNGAEDIEKANIADIFTNIDSIRFFGKEKFIRKKFKEISTETQNKAMKYWNYYRWFDAGHVLILGVGTVLLLYFPIKEFIEGTITIGSLVFIYTVYSSLIGKMFGFIHGIRGFYRAMGDFQDLFNYGKISKKIEDKKESKNIKIKKGQIEFKNIDFRYNNDRKIFKNFNLKIPSNKTVAFVGHSGCGKSSLIKLLYRLYDVDKGEILVDGQNIKDVKQESLRSEMSIVPQECILFDDTVYNNIRFANPKAKRKEVLGAIRFAQLDRVIQNFPQKEKTIVGERGVKLSGGEKQRVSIARAILANKRVLVLDEATSALDSETEWQIQQDLEKLMEGRTGIVIAHRLSTIMKADMIVVMKDGKIEQKGNHRDLITQGGEYAKLWEFQKGGFVE